MNHVPAAGPAPLPPLGQMLAGKRLPSLDGLRACSVFVVMTYHFGVTAVPGDLGVSAFLVLSGFLITWLLLKEFDRTGTISLRDFYMRRVLRIFPAYYVFLAVSLGIDYLRGDPHVRELILPGMTYMMNYYNALHGHPPTSIAHAWSLAIEEQFYLLWPVLFIVLVRKPMRSAIGVLAGLVVLFATWRSFIFLTHRASSSYVYNAFETRADILALGCLLAFLLRLRAVQRRCSVLALSPLFPVVTIAVLVLSRVGGRPDYHYSVGFAIDAMLIAILLVQLLLLHESRWWSWLNWPAIRYLGAISYPLYLYHIWALGLAARLVRSDSIVRLVAAAVISIALASLSYYVVERPFVRLKSRFATQ